MTGRLVRRTADPSSAFERGFDREVGRLWFRTLVALFTVDLPRPVAPRVRVTLSRFVGILQRRGVACRRWDSVGHRIDH